MDAVKLAISTLKKHLLGVYEILEKVDEDCSTATQKARQLKKGILMGTMTKDRQIEIVNEIMEVLNGERI